MSIVDELRSLDTNDPGRWPLPIRAGAIALAFAAVTAFGVYMLVYKQEIPLLERAEQEERDLRTQFEDRQRKAANFDAYRTQLAEIERDFGAMLRQLPGKTEVPSLLVDISQTGLGAGLEEQQFTPAGEIHKDFYAELPIRLRYTGSYHELGNFVSGIAALPRIVTLHDITIRPVSATVPDELVLDVTAKTYRYLDEEATEGLWRRVAYSRRAGWSWRLSPQPRARAAAQTRTCRRTSTTSRLGPVAASSPCRPSSRHRSSPTNQACAARLSCRTSHNGVSATIRMPSKARIAIGRANSWSSSRSTH